MDERYKVAISRLGSRVRVAGSAEIGGSLGHLNDAALGNAVQGAARLVPRRRAPEPGAALEGRAADAPDGPPVLGRSGIEGVWLNLGHGSSGWALSCGSARVLADAIAGRQPAIDIEGLGVERLVA